MYGNCTSEGWGWEGGGLSGYFRGLLKMIKGGLMGSRTIVAIYGGAVSGFLGRGGRVGQGDRQGSLIMPLRA